MHVLKYRSKIGGSLFAILFAVSAILYVGAFNTATPAIGLSVLGVVWVVCLFIYSAIEYTMTNKELTVTVRYFYNKTILISSITKIKEADTFSWAPALSLDRIMVLTRSGEYVIVSPQNTQGFIRELKYRNPNIIVEVG